MMPWVEGGHRAGTFPYGLFFVGQVVWVAAVSYFDVSWVWWLFVFLLALGALGAAYYLGILSIVRVCFGTGLCIVFLLIAFTYNQDLSRYEALQNHFSKAPVYWLHGKVLGFPDQDSKRVQFLFQVDQAVEEGRELKQATERHWRLQLSDYRSNSFDYTKEGSWWLKVKLNAVYSTNEPHVFNYSTYLYVQSIEGTGYVKAHLADSQQLNGIGGKYQAFRLSVWRFLDDFEYGGLLRALLLGDKQSIDPQDKRLFQRFGVMHFLVISGLHVGLVFFFVYQLMSFLSFLFFRSQMGRFYFTTLFLGLLCALLYVWLGGGSPPAWRAWWMLCFYVLARLYGGGRVDFLRTLHFSAAVLILFKPVWVFSVGFWLSYWSVLGIGLFLKQFWPVVAQYFKGVLGVLAGALLLSVFLSIWLLPWWLYLGIESGFLSGLLSAVFGFFFSWFLLPSLLFGLVFFLLLQIDLARLFWGFADAGLGVFMSALNAMESSWSVWWFRIDVWVFVLLLGCLCLLAWYWRNLKVSLMLWLLVGALLLMGNFRIKPLYGHMRAFVMDIAHGLSVLIETNSHTLLFDTGYASQTRFVVLPKIGYLGHEKLDAFVVSHQDADHAGGKQLVLEQLVTNKHYEGQANTLPSGVLCQQQEAWVWDGVVFEFVHPIEGVPVRSGNNASSCVLRVSAGGKVFLITSDIGMQQERAIIDSEKSAKADVMVAPHQGSRYSSSDAWLNYHSKLTDVLFVHKRFNSYGHPAESVIQKYRSRNISMHATGCSGGVQIEMGDGQIFVKHAWQWRWQRAGLPDFCAHMKAADKAW